MESTVNPLLDPATTLEVTFILGLAYSESHIPQGGFVQQETQYNNYFGVFAGSPSANPVPYSNGVTPNIGGNYYYSLPGPGIQQSLNWFEYTYGSQVAGADTPSQFVADLNSGPNHFNAGPSFPASATGGIQAITSHLDCTLGGGGPGPRRLLYGGERRQLPARY